ncbi:hypothetical protein [Spirosoma spitsbergense]|uniref:hypothetical protein n=1 Tax=Spirosoma spitsbergense TaxID=431554 RepID=UPI00035D97CF|nr:hypothetical protein [Spirosoma spitsbergense]
MKTLSSKLSITQQDFISFYDTQAPKLWGLILLANLPLSTSEGILTNTFIKAWQDLDNTPFTKNYSFTQLIDLACKEGLPIGCLKALLNR